MMPRPTEPAARRTPMRAASGDAEPAQEIDRYLGDLAVCRASDPGDAVVGGRRCGPQVGRQRRRFELALLGDRMDRCLVVGVIAQPQPRVPALDAVVPGHVKARVGRSDLVDGRPHRQFCQQQLQG